MCGPTGGSCVAAMACTVAPKVGRVVLLCCAWVDGGCLEDMSDQSRVFEWAM